MPSRKAVWKRCRARRRPATADVAVALVLALAGGLAVSGCARIIDTATPHPAPPGSVPSSPIRWVICSASGPRTTRTATGSSPWCQIPAPVRPGRRMRRSSSTIIEPPTVATGWPPRLSRCTSRRSLRCTPLISTPGRRSPAPAARWRRAAPPFTVTDMKGREYHFSMGVAGRGFAAFGDLVVPRRRLGMRQRLRRGPQRRDRDHHVRIGRRLRRERLGP